MSLTHKDISLLTQKSSLAGTEKIPVSATEYITPTQIAGLVNTGIPVASSQPVGGMLPNVFYNLGTLTGAVTLLFASPSDNTILNEYMFCFDSGSTAAVPTWPSSITSWVGNCVGTNGDPVISADKFYEVSVLNGVGIITEV